MTPQEMQKTLSSITDNLPGELRVEYYADRGRPTAQIGMINIANAFRVDREEVESCENDKLMIELIKSRVLKCLFGMKNKLETDIKELKNGCTK